jgi:molybdate transport system substrate-binding protein
MICIAWWTFRRYPDAKYRPMVNFSSESEAMRRRSVVVQSAVATAAGFLGVLTASLNETIAGTAEIKVLTSVALRSALTDLTPLFEHATGDKLVIGYGLIADVRKRVLAGETADVIILSRPVMDELEKKKRIAPGSVVDVAATAVAVAVRRGAAKPDISSVAAFKRTLLNARSVVYADPAKGGASGVYFVEVLERLGISEQMKPKAILVPGAQAAEVVASGKAELGIGQTSEIVPIAGADLVGPFPADLGRLTVFSAGTGITSTSSRDAAALIRFLTAEPAARVFRAKGFEPR